MTFLDVSFPTPEENLACDEALLDRSEEEEGGEVLRFWESPSPFVVLGVSNVAAQEVNLEACSARGIPVLRRHSGGGCVMQGPGCLNYALVLKIPETGPLKSIAGTNALVLGRLATALETLVKEEVRVMGQSDLTLGGRKFSGNAQRRRLRFLLFHGTILLSLDLALLDELLPYPSQSPAYRERRPHRDFLINLGLMAEQVKEAIRAGWSAAGPPPSFPLDRMHRMIAERYSRREWNFRR